MDTGWLNIVWFVLFVIIIAGYLIMDGFDLGVGILHPFLAKNDQERRVSLNSIGPVWDGNEVWLVLGGGALFAAFPLVYASLFSGFYTAMMLVLLVLILRTVAIEFNMDHTKYASIIGQSARVAGNVNGKATDANFILDEKFFFYKLHNGANHIMLNLVKRVPLFRQPDETCSLSAIGKFGFGIMLPHSENIVMGNKNDVGDKSFGNLVGTSRGWWQIDGWTTGIEVGFRFGLTKHLYLELTDKVAYARLSDIPVFQGTASHSLWMNEVILSLGVTFGGGR